MDKYYCKFKGSQADVFVRVIVTAVDENGARKEAKLLICNTREINQMPRVEEATFDEEPLLVQKIDRYMFLD